MVSIIIRHNIIAYYIIEARTDLINYPYILVLNIWEMSTKISTKKNKEKKPDNNAKKLIRIEDFISPR